MTALDIDAIRAKLHHRYPFLMVDRVTRLEGKEIWGYKNVTHNEPYFAGHFPDFPVMPGVLIIEAMAQLSGLIILGPRTEPEERNMVFMGVDKVRFRRAVRPGDKLEMHARLIYHREAERTEQAKIEAQAHVDGELVATATFLIGLFSNTDA
ncbi:3-hydroxyacyl-ACP dehydratase FabZ [candidate division WOR-3 bacterium]|nr:3-hydroxyacyl-ACP dehydratase FabZ [candidate division WOR-3 bacterium]MCK4334838.1 3-hydroxyacyl-ACP dehydratase FabZ [candidate division WOR-3 bacterium]